MQVIEADCLVRTVYVPLGKRKLEDIPTTLHEGKKHAFHNAAQIVKAERI